MKFEVNRLMMLEAAENATGVAPSNSAVEVLNGILVECNDDTGEVFLTATNHEVSIQQKIMTSVAESGAMLVNSRILVGMMSMLEGEFVTLSADNPGLLTVTGGRCTYQVKCLPPKSYPKPIMPFPEESVIMTGICSLAKRTAFTVSKDDSKPSLQCVQVKLKNNAVHAAACDGMRMMLVRDIADSPDEREFLLPGRSLKTLAAISSDDDVFEVGDIGNEIVFVRGDMIFAIRKLVTGEYMDTAAVIKNINPDYSAVVDSGKLKEALSFISVGALADNTKTPINFVMASGEIVLRCSNDYSEVSTAVAANVSKDTPSAGFFYDVSALIKLFQVMMGKIKIEVDTKGFMLIKTRSEVYLQLPMRAPVTKDKPAKQDKNSSQSEHKGKEPKRAKGTKGVKNVA